MKPGSRTSATLVTLGAILTIGLAALVVIDTFIARSIATAEAQKSLAATASIIAAHARRTLADVSAVISAEPFPPPGQRDPAATGAWLDVLNASIRAMPQVARVELSDRRHISAARSGIATQTKRGNAVYRQWLGHPLRDPGTGRLLLPLFHELGPDPDAPVMVAYLDLGFFHAFYRSIVNLAQTTTALLLEDGTLLASDEVASPSGAARPADAARWLHAESELVDDGGPLDGYVGAVVRIPEFGLAIVSRRKLSAALEPWGDQALGVAIPAAALAALALLLLHLTRRHLLRIEAGTLERRRLEFEREELRRSLQHASRIESLGRLASGIAHDFSNVLSAVLGYGELVRDNAGTDPVLRRHAERIVIAAQRGKALVDRLLAFVRAERGPIRATAIDPLVNETLDMLDASLKPGVRLERACCARAATIRAAPSGLHQVLMNLATNALQALNGRGTVRVSTRIEELTAPHRARTGTVGPGTVVRIEVGDTGPGIADDVLEHIFEPFYTTKSAGAGTGLGLSLVRELVDELDGAIDVDTRIGSGTTFTVFLPCNAVGLEPESAGDDVLRGNGETILLVDDDATLVELGEELLAALGYEPVGFASPLKAWEAFRSASRRFDAVLTDETMPGCSGMELAGKIRTLRTDIPILVVSGNPAAERAEQLKPLGIEAVLRKPLAASELSRALARVLPRRAAAVSH